MLHLQVKRFFPISILKSQKTSGSFGNFHLNDQEKRGKIRTDTSNLVFCDLQKSNKGLTILKKHSQCNKPRFCPLVKLQHTKN